VRSEREGKANRVVREDRSEGGRGKGRETKGNDGRRRKKGRATKTQKERAKEGKRRGDGLVNKG
jgi:hypothetical protein